MVNKPHINMFPSSERLSKRCGKKNLSGMVDNATTESENWTLTATKPDFLVSKKRGATARVRTPTVVSKPQPKEAKISILD